MIDERKKYKDLLSMFCENKKLLELLNETIKDDIIMSEHHYVMHKKYPEKRDLLKKLISDLATKRQEKNIIKSRGEKDNG